MTAAGTHRRALVGVAVAIFIAVFLAFEAYEKPGLGIGHFYYVAIALVALATGPRAGAIAGAAGAALYGIGILLNPSIPSTEVLTASAGIRFVTFTGIGLLIGWFAADNRALVERLHVLAERDFLTGLPNTRAFETAITRRLEAGEPFVLLLGDVDRMKAINDERGHSEGNDALQRMAEVFSGSLAPEDDVARVGGDEFAVLTTNRNGEEAGRLAARLEALLAPTDTSITFGWAVYPHEGENALSLYRVADERLYARKLVRGHRRGGIVPLRPVPPPEVIAS